MNGLLSVERRGGDEMAAKQRPVLGIDHVTVVPANFEAEPDVEAEEREA